MPITYEESGKVHSVQHLKSLVFLGCILSLHDTITNSTVWTHNIRSFGDFLSAEVFVTLHSYSVTFMGTRGTPGGRLEGGEDTLPLLSPEMSLVMLC